MTSMCKPSITRHGLLHELTHALFSFPCNGLVWMQIEAVDLWMVGQRALDPHWAFWINNGCFSVLLLLMSKCTYVEHSSCVFCRNVKGTGYRSNTEARRQGIQFRICFFRFSPTTVEYVFPLGRKRKHVEVLLFYTVKPSRHHLL